MIELLIAIGGLLLLIAGGELLVRGSVGIAKSMAVPPLIIGLTVVSFGTSAPELLVSLNAALGGNPGIAVGNVLGSNIANIALVLGVTVMIFPVLIQRQTIRLDWPVMMFASLLFYLFALDNIIERWEGIILFIILICYIVVLINTTRRNKKTAPPVEELEDAPKSVPLSILFLLLGLVGLYFGSEYFVSGASDLAAYFGMSESMIGLTIVAFGTSAPELVASTIAAFRKEADLAVGNLIGSNIFNIFAVLGITSTVTPIDVDNNVLTFDMFWMLGIAAIILPFMLSGRKMNKWEGAVLFLGYISYIGILIASL